MSSGFPPVPVYPTGYDSDFTLFQVYNTSEAVTVDDTDAFSEEIPIRPVGADKPEIWADNGWATIAGELFYYDAVNKDTNGHVCRLRRCVRNLGGKQSQFNEAGTWVRGFVVAEHHNQLADCILLIENFVGENFSENPATLDWRIRHLAEAPIISDDFGCPDIEFDFNILSSNPTTGTLASYNVLIQGAAANFTLQFGDGQSTSSARAGTHQYAPGAIIDPVIVMQNDTCQIVQTGITRENPQTPKVTIQKPPFIVPVPLPPVIPPILIPSIIIPGPTLNVPPVVFPCVTPQGFPSVVLPPINIPSQIDITPINIPSQITITPVNIPSMITGPDIQVPSTITFENPPNFPNMIPIGPAPPMPPIQVQPPQIPPIQTQPIQVQGAEDFPSVIMIEAPNLPSVIPIIIGIHGIPNTISVVGDAQVSLIHDLRELRLVHDLPRSLQIDPIPNVKFDVKNVRKVMKSLGQTFGEALKINMPNFNEMKLKVDWSDMPTLKAVLKIQKPKKGQYDVHGGVGLPEPEFEHVDFPDHIPISVPEIPPLKVEHSIPTTIGVKMPDIKDIKIDARSVPKEIQLILPKESMQISVVPFTMPHLKVDTEGLEKLSIPVKFPDKMPEIAVRFPEEMPTLKVEFPAQMPTLKIEVPESARIPLFYDGPPLPVQLNLKIQDLAGEAADNIQCVAIMPCPRR